jgi:hypothetical protein
MTFGRELVVLLTKPSMFSKFLVHAWRWCGGLNKEHSILVHGGSNSFWCGGLNKEHSLSVHGGPNSF